MSEQWYCDLCGELSVVDVSIETDGTVACGLCAAELTLDPADVFEIALGRCKKAEERISLLENVAEALKFIVDGWDEEMYSIDFTAVDDAKTALSAAGYLQ
jgi:hypothetical protein